MNSVSAITTVNLSLYQNNDTEEKALDKVLGNLVGDEMKDEEDNAIKTQKDQDAEINSDNGL